MSELLDRPELAAAGGLIVTLAWLALFYWHKVRPVGDDVGARLDALQPAYEIADLAVAGPPVEHRDYSGDRGVVPDEVSPGLIPVPVMPNIMDTLLREMGMNRRMVGQ